ncbi:OmpA family protein [Streptomyces sp. SS7]|uniref:OmpA family protein n=1 Tax=Streptomyces sp. SS7 TaxID=3108485 RepID=UPI0030EE0F65
MFHPRVPASSPHLTLAVASAITVAAATTVCTAAPAHAAGPSTPRSGASATMTAWVDPHDPTLKLATGATLAPPKILDIKSVTEDLGGDERREDTPTDVTFALQAEVLFAKDSAHLTGSAKARIGAIAKEIKQQGATQVRVFGFTDNLGSHAHGLVLSKQRASAVQDVLADALNAPDITFEVRGYAEQYPIADNATEDGRRKNRRVEIAFPRATK